MELTDTFHLGHTPGKPGYRPRPCTQRQDCPSVLHRSAERLQAPYGKTPASDKPTRKLSSARVQILRFPQDQAIKIFESNLGNRNQTLRKPLDVMRNKGQQCKGPFKKKNKKKRAREKSVLLFFFFFFFSLMQKNKTIDI